MIRDIEYFESWERERLKEDDLDFESKLRLMDAMYEWARQLGVFPAKDPLERTEVDLRIAKALNVRTGS
jgi:hypothetical protein